MFAIRRFLLFHPSLVLAMILVSVRVGCGRSERPQIGLDLSRPVEVVGWVGSAIQRLPGRIHLDLKPISVAQDSVRFPYSYRVRVSIYAPGRSGQAFFEPPLRYGEVVRLDTLLRDPQTYAVPGTLDSRDLRFQQGILHTIRLKSPLQVERTGGHRGSAVLRPVFQYTRQFEDFCEKTVSSDTLKLILSVFLGRKTVLEESDRRQISRLGIFHLFVVSGFHVTVLLSFFHLIFGPLGQWRLWLSLGGMWMYVCVTGAGIATVRAGVMVTVCYLLGLGGLRYRFLNIVGLSACIVVLLWPTTVFHPGFQFSYLSVGALGAIAFPRLLPLRAMMVGFSSVFSERIWVGQNQQNKRRRRARFWFEEVSQFWRPSYRRLFPPVAGLFFRIGSLAICTVSIQLMTLPLSLYYSNAWGLWQLVANLLLIPPFLLFVFSCVLLFGTFWLPGGEWMAALIDIFGQGLAAAGDLLASWGGPSYYPQPQVWQIILFYSLVAICFLGSRWLRWLLLAAPLVLLVPLPSKAHPAGRLTITMLDVGQGESIHLRYPDGSDALVDTGGRPPLGNSSSDFVGERLVSRYLWGQRVKGLRYILLTHPHADHVQGYAFVRKVFPIGRLIFHEYSSRYQPFAGTDCLRAGDGFMIADVEHAVLHPALRCTVRPQSDTNNASLVFLLRYGDFSMLFTGDLEAQGERALLPRLPPVTVLKSPHHGSKSSNTGDLLRRSQPDVVLISAGRDNVFGHPSRATRLRLRRLGIPFFVTATAGSLRVETDGKSWRLLRYSRAADGFVEVPVRVGMSSQTLSSSSPKSGRS